MVQMLMEVSGGNVLDDRDIALARAAGRWAHSCAGWRPHLHNSFVFQNGAGLHFWVLAVGGQTLEVRVGPGQGIWHTHLEVRVDDVGHALNLLAAEGLIPARFSTLGRGVLEDFAESLERSGTVMAELADDFDADQACEPWELRIHAEVLQIVAEQARGFPGAELAVMS